MKRLLSGLALAVALAAAAEGGDATVTPEEHRRRPEQTYLTYPEWFLVFSPAEYATLVKDAPPSEFPFLGHVAQFWQGYREVWKATQDAPFNSEYHVMIGVIGASVTVEYALRSAYETLVGRLTEITRFGSPTDEDRFGARVAQEYVDFIRVRPWYEFDFASRLAGLWTETSFWGSDPLRKWERRYALTTEYLAKGIYGWAQMVGTRAAYGEQKPVTAVVVEGLTPALEAQVPGLVVLQRLPDGATLATVPRYEAFMASSMALARHGARFREIAGNRGLIMLSAVVPRDWKPAVPQVRALFTQAILTRPGTVRVALAVPVAALAATLLELDRPPLQLEHVYDY